MKFQCQESCGGKCCYKQWDNKATFVFLTVHDRFRISSFLNKPAWDFAKYAQFDSTRFTDKKSYQWYLQNDGNKCIFLKEGKCSIYEVRPTQCRTFPFWPELMTKLKYEDLKKHCPGIGIGEETNHRLLVEQIAADEEMRSK